MNDAPEATKLYIKQCAECYAKLSIASFSLHRGSPDGYQNLCKLCASEYGAVRYANSKGRVKTTPLDGITRMVRFQNMDIIKHALSSREPVSVYGFTPHQSAIYRVTFGPHPLGRSMLIESINECGVLTEEFRHEYLYSNLQVAHLRDPLYIAGTLLQVLKENRIRLEFSESDMLDSKTEIYYLE